MTQKFFHNSDSLQDRPLILVAGGAGFIGSFLSELLLQQNCRVICLDNLITGSKKNIANLLDNKNFTFVKQNLNQTLNLEISRLDYIFHLAALEPYVGESDFSLETFLTNVSGTINLLKLAEETGAKFLLGSSPKVFEAKISTQKLIDYFGQGSAAEMASFAEAKRSAEALVSEYMDNEKIDARIVRLNWVYGPRMNLEQGGILAQLIKQAVKDESLAIPGDGSQRIRPTFISDVVYGLSKAMFSSGTSGKIFNFMNPTEETVLSVAHQLQNIIGQNLKIEYVAEEEFPVFELDPDLGRRGNLDWTPKINLSEGLEQTLVYFRERIKKKVKRETKEDKESKEERTEKEERKVKKKKKFSISRQKRLIIGLTLIFLLIVFSLPGLLVLNSLLGIKNLYAAYQNTLAGNFTKTTVSANAAKRDFTRAQENLQSIGPLLTFVGQRKLQNKIEGYLTLGQQAGRSVVILGEIAQEMSQVGQAIFQNQKVDIQELSFEISAEIDSAYRELSYLEGQLKSKPRVQQFLATRFNNQPIENLKSVREMLLQTKEGVKLLPDLAGVYNKKTYLILFQNNMELRPTGGFIGSFALATLEEGRLIDFQVLDVYSADGQLKGHVEPPEPIRRYLGEAGWYLRDSNFSPDFPVSASRASWFLEKEIGRKVDGVIGIDLFLAQRILQTIGSVKLIDYQEEINADNLFERAEYYSEVNFFPGSTQKRDFLGALANALFEEIRTAGSDKWLALGRAFYQSLESKDLLIFLNNQEAAKILADLSWDGGLRNVNCLIEKGKCLVDYLMIVESNYGVNKANYFVKRNLTHQVKFSSTGEVEEVLRIDYHNQSQSEVFPAGDYKNYLRILTPLETMLRRVVIDGKEIDEDKIDKTEEKGKSSFGLLVEVPIQTKKTVEISYQLADKLPADSGNQYLLYLQKQPGIEDKIFNLWLVPPSGTIVVSTHPEASLASGLVIFTPQFNQDLVFEVSF